jgi:hypothetical protein
MESERLNKALEFSNYRITLSNQLNLFKSKVKSLQYISVNGGTFFIDRSLISFVRMLLQMGYSESVLLDINDLPIEIDNLEGFFEDIFSRYFEAINEYNNEYKKIKKARSVEKVINFD